jgi:hypothetical protein
MEKKDKKHISVRPRTKWRIADVLLQLAIVIAGILVTFQGTALINRTSQKREVRKILVMVEDELRQNRGVLLESEFILKRELEGMAFFARHMRDIRSANADSVHLLVNVLDTGPGFSYGSNALEVLKASTASVNVMDKRLLMDIFVCYDSIGDLFSSLNYYYTQKFGLAADFYFSTDRRTIEKHRQGDPIPYIEKYMENPGTGNLILNADINLNGRLQAIDSLNTTFGKTIEAIERYTDKRNRKTN